MFLRHENSACRSLTVVGLESSCDDTAAAIVSHEPGAPPNIRSSVVLGQGSLHSRFGGIVPEIAARAHAVKLDVAAEEAMAEAGLTFPDIDAVAVTAGPGLLGGLMTGIAFAQGFAASLGKPLIGINHLAGHALTVRLFEQIEFPYLALLASGGHCQFLAVLSPDRYLRLGGTIDDAPGEAFDKSARLMGLEQPGGPAIEEAARGGDPKRFSFPRPLSGKQGCNLSFSGLKTSAGRICEGLRDGGELTTQAIADISAGFQEAVSDILAEKTGTALEEFKNRVGTVQTVAVCGGVAANRTICRALLAECERHAVRFIAPDPAYCTDNGAMIAWAGIERIRAEVRYDPDLQARPRWPLDAVSTPILGYGKKGPKS